MKSILKSGSFWFIILALLFLIVGVLATIWQWGWLHPKEPTAVSNSETLRNVGLLIGGGLAFAFAGWRAWVAERQAETARLSLLNERYQRGAEMLGNGNLAVRMGGVGALKRLADQYPEHYHIQVMELFCAFVRHPTIDEDANLQGKLREDVQVVMTAVGSRGEIGLGLEVELNYALDLQESDLSLAVLSGANLKGANLSRVKLHHANFFETPLLSPDLSKPIPSGPNQPQARTTLSGENIPPDLAGFEHRQANLSLAILERGDLEGADLLGVVLSGAQLMAANLSKSRIIYASLQKAVLLDANLSGAFVLCADLSGAQLAGANLEGAQFPGTKLYGANFIGASLKDADFSGAVLSKDNGKYVATGLTQSQLNEVIVDVNDLPDLTGVYEVGSGKQLIWNKQSSEEGS